MPGWSVGSTPAVPLAGEVDSETIVWKCGGMWAAGPFYVPGIYSASKIV